MFRSFVLSETPAHAPVVSEQPSIWLSMSFWLNPNQYHAESFLIGPPRSKFFSKTSLMWLFGVRLRPEPMFVGFQDDRDVEYLQKAHDVDTAD